MRYVSICVPKTLLLNLRKPRALAPEKAKLGRQADKSQRRIVDVPNVASGRDRPRSEAEERKNDRQDAPGDGSDDIANFEASKLESRVSNAACVAP